MSRKYIVNGRGIQNLCVHILKNGEECSEKYHFLHTLSSAIWELENAHDPHEYGAKCDCVNGVSESKL